MSISLSASHSAVSGGTAQNVWKLWANVEQWPTWDNS